MIASIEMMFSGWFPRFLVDVITIFVLTAMIVIGVLMFLEGNDIDERSKKK